MVAGFEFVFFFNLGNFNETGFGVSGMVDITLSRILLNLLAIVVSENLLLFQIPSFLALTLKLL